MQALVAMLLSSLSGAALSIISRLIGKEFFEELLVKLIVKGAQKYAEKTENKTDDELVKILVDRLNVTSPIFPEAKK